MTFISTVQAFLADDAVLMALLVGGLYRYEQTGRSGISRSSTPDNAFADFNATLVLPDPAQNWDADGWNDVRLEFRDLEAI